MPVPSERNERRAAAAAPFPDLQTLTEGLTAVLDGQTAESDLVHILDRKPNPYTSTFPAEVVTCIMADRREQRVLCKYTGHGGHSDHGHRGGVGYEAEVYRQVLQGLPVPVPTFHGVFACPEAGGICLVLQYLEAGIRASKLPVPDAMPAAAAWAGRFHAWNEQHPRRREFSFLTRYNADYYVGWSRRTVRYARVVLADQPWLGALCRSYEDRIPVLISRPQTVIHGEYTPHNILWHEGGIYPTDWESAALAPGEIDLAILVEGWDQATIDRCVHSYRQARGAATDRSFEEALGIAQLYVAFRWLAARGDWTDARSLSLLRELYRLGAQLRLIV